jgi:hypothetical protein
MNLIPYEEFSINENTLDKLNEHYVNRKISDYFTQHGQLPDSGTVETYGIPSELMDRYKKYYYSEYYKKEWELEKEYGPSEIIETTFDFSTIEDIDSTVLGSPSLRFGAGVSGGDKEYQYEYWSIIIIGDNWNFRRIGSFTSLKNVTISLNSLKEYTIYAYLRKSDYLYDSISEGFQVDNQFHKFVGNTGQTISNYVNGTQMEDAEYIGVVNNYKPTPNGVITGSVYSLNPHVEITFSGFTNGMSCEFAFQPDVVSIIINYKENGELETAGVGDINRLTKLTDTSFMYLVTKQDLIPVLRLGHYTRSNIGNIQSPQCELIVPHIHLIVYKPNGLICDGVESNILEMYRNTLTYGVIYVPPQGEEIDTGFDIDIIDD